MRRVIVADLLEEVSRRYDLQRRRDGWPVDWREATRERLGFEESERKALG